MASQGPLSAGGGDTSGSPLWTNPGDIVASENTRATRANITAGTITGTLTSTTHGFTIPDGSTIDGIVAEFERYGTGGSIRDESIRLTTGGTAVGDEKAITASNWPILSGEAYETYGSPTDTWGRTWTPAEINATTFGLNIIARNTHGSNTRDALVDHVRITVYYTEGGGGPTTDTRTVPATAAIATRDTRTVPTSAAVASVADRTVPATAAIALIDTRTVPASAAIASQDTRTVPASAAVATENTQTVPATAAVAVEATRTVPAQAAIAEIGTRTVPATAAVDVVGETTDTRTVPATAAIQTQDTRTIPASAAVALEDTRTVPAAAAVSLLGERTVPAVVAVALLETRTVPATAALATVGTRTVPATAAVTTQAVPRNPRIVELVGSAGEAVTLVGSRRDITLVGSITDGSS